MTSNYNPDQKRDGPANPGNWSKYVNSDPEGALPENLTATQRVALALREHGFPEKELLTSAASYTINEASRALFEAGRTLLDRGDEVGSAQYVIGASTLHRLPGGLSAAKGDPVLARAAFAQARAALATQNALLGFIYRGGEVPVFKGIRELLDDAESVFDS